MNTRSRLVSMGLGLSVALSLAFSLAVGGGCGASGGGGDPFPLIRQDTAAGSGGSGVYFGGDALAVVDTSSSDHHVNGGTPCQSDGDCPAEAAYCSLIEGVCVQCFSTVDCDGVACVDGRCVGGGGGVCEPGTTICDGDEIVVCGPDGEGELERRDCAPNVCVDGTCRACRPGAVSCQEGAVVRCNADGSGVVVVEACAVDGVCVDGRCAACFPNTGRCDGVEAQRCAGDGSAWVFQQDCGAQGFDCVQGTCVNPCTLDPKTQTNAGCDFWAVDLDNAYEVGLDGTVYDAQSAQFAIIVSNTSDEGAAEVTVTMPDDRQELRVIQPRTLDTFLLPATFSLDGSGVSRYAYRVQSTRPVTVYQFNPLANVDVFSNDASVLMPTPSLGTEYYVATLPQTGTYVAYFTVVAVESGMTQVTLRPTANTAAGPEVPAMTRGVEYVINLDRGQVLNVESAELGGDLSGTHIRTSQRAVVFGGHEAAVTRVECCADHLEQQLLPVSRWGNRYVATHSMRRGLESDHYLILASLPDTHVTLRPAVATIDPVLAPSLPLRFEAREDFEVTADHPILLVQYLASSHEVIATPGGGFCSTGADCPSGYSCWAGSCEAPSCTSPANCPAGHTCANDGGFGGVCLPVGDPAMIQVVPTAQFRKEFLFLTPNSYVEDYINIVAPTGAVVSLDDEPVASSLFSPVGSSGYSVYRVRVADGVHVVSGGTQPVGIIVYGYDRDVSYGYPGGIGLEELNPTE